jgi:hypothetical protein
MKNDSPIANAEIPQEQLVEIQTRLETESRERPLDSPHFTFTIVCEVAPFEVAEPCDLKMRADTEHGEIRGGTIPVIQGLVPTR